MSIAIRCGSCSRNYRVNRELQGKRFRCKNCGHVLRVPETHDSADDGFPEDGDESSHPVPFTQRRLPPRIRGTARPKRNRQKTGTKKRRTRKWLRLSVPNGLRWVLAGLLLQLLAILLGLAPLGFVGWLVAFLLSLAATILSTVGQTMCLKAPEQSGIRSFIHGVLAFQGFALVTRLASLAIPPLLLMSLLASAAAFLLFVFALKRLAEFSGSASGEMHAEAILYWGMGLVILRAVPGDFSSMLGEDMFGPLVLIVVVASLLVYIKILGHYVDLLGCLKEEYGTRSSRTMHS